jgi:putative membrane protein
VKPLIVVLLLAGLALAIGLLAWQGFATISAVLGTGGWWLCVLAPAYMVYLLLDTLAWRKICVAGSPRFSRLYYANWIGNSVNWLLPVGQVGGDAVRVHQLMLGGMRGSEAGASIIVDKTLQAVTLVFYALVGLCLLILHAGTVPVTAGVLVFALLLTIAIYIFYRLQHQGIFGQLTRLNSTAVQRLAHLAEGAAALDAAIVARYRDYRSILVSIALRMLHRFSMAAEVYIAMHLLGQPLGFTECIILQSLGQAVRAAAFLVPGALGVQEGGFLVLGMSLGLDAEFGLALSLAKRLRELLVGLPGLMAWHVSETRRWSRNGRRNQAR